MTDDAEARIASLIANAKEYSVSGDAGNNRVGKPRVRVDRVNPDLTGAALRDVLAQCPGQIGRAHV